MKDNVMLRAMKLICTPITQELRIKAVCVSPKAYDELTSLTPNISKYNEPYYFSGYPVIITYVINDVALIVERKE